MIPVDLTIPSPVPWHSRDQLQDFELSKTKNLSAKALQISHCHFASFSHPSQ